MPVEPSRVRSRRARSSSVSVAVVRVGEAEQRPRVGDESLLARRNVEHPERVDGIVAGAAAEEHDPVAVG